MSFNGDLYPTAGADVVMTTKGDMVDYNTARQRLGIGSTNQILQVKSGLPSWETLSTAGSVLTTQGDVLYEGAAGLARLGFGTSGDVLTTKGTGANPVWETPSGGGGSLELLDSYQATGAESTTTLSWTSIDMKADYSAIYIVYQISPTAILEVQAQIDGITAGEYYGGSLRQLSTTLTGASWGWSTSIPIGTTNIFGTTNEAGSGNMLIQFNDHDDRWYYNWTTTSHDTQEWGGGYEAKTGMDENITQVLFQTSTSTWKIGSTITAYGIKRA